MNNDTTMVSLDRDRTIKFRRKELKMLEKVTGKTLAKIDFESMDVDSLTKMIHVGLIHEEPELTLETVEDLLDNSETTFGEVVQVSMEAFSIAMGGKRTESRENSTGDSTKN